MAAARHILIYTDDPGIYGVAQYNHALALGLLNAGDRVTLAQARRDHALLAEQRARGVGHAWLSSDDFGRSLGDPGDGQRILAEVRPDVVLFSNCCPLSNFAAKRVVIEHGTPFVATEMFVAPYLAERFAPLLPELERHYAAAAEVVAVSQENLSLLRQSFRLPADRGRIIYFGRPDAFFDPPDQRTRARLRQEVNVPADAVMAFTAARMEAVKGYQHQLAAIDVLRREPVWRNLYFVWAGGGSLLDAVRQAVARAGLADRVKVLGERADVRGWLDASDMFILPSEAEGMPLAVMEAMAKGVPVAATAVSGIPEELGDTGRLLPPPAPDPNVTVAALVETVKTWAADGALRREVGRACRSRADMMFRQQRMIDQTRNLLHAASTATDRPAAAQTGIEFPAGDYVSPNFERVRLDTAFPNMTVRDKRLAAWRYVRKDVPHNWYVDRRSPDIGFLSRDEAHILYNSALRWRGRRALEIGCWLGWSACHLAAGGVELDVVDPLLDRPEVGGSVRESLAAAGVAQRVHLHAGYSPAEVLEVARREGRTWGLIFIDGDHDAPGPRNDAVAAESVADADALILFHDLSSPDVGQGLDYLRSRGWNTMVYQTMQIMGVAWRGAARPVEHLPDPSVQWTLPAHLRDYTVSGVPAAATADRTLEPSALTDAALAAYVGEPTEQTLAPLLAARRRIAEAWLALGDDLLRPCFNGTLGRVHVAMLNSGVRSDPQQGEPSAAESEFVSRLLETVSRGPTAAGFVQALLAAQLFRRADQLPLAASLDAIPDWLQGLFMTYLLAQPEVFTETGECDRHHRFLREWEGELLRQVTVDAPSERAKAAVIEFSMRANMIPIYFTADDVKEVHVRRAKLLEAALTFTGRKLDHQPAPRPAGGGKLRVGILAAHFGPQTETYHTLPYYEHVDRSRVEVTLFTLQPMAHPLSQYCASRAERVVHLSGHTDQQVSIVRAADLDVLVVGTNVGAVTNAVTVLALHRLARVQATLFSSPTTTGFRNIDVFVSGELSEGPGAQEQYTERLIQLPGCGFCFGYAASGPEVVSGDAPTRASFGLPEDAVVFASGANFYKIIPETIETWAQIIAAVPGSRLMLYPFGAAWSSRYPVTAFLHMVYGTFARHGLESDRLVVLHAQPNRAAVKQCLALCDVYLDSLRHAGGHSLVDPLEVGLPSVSVEGPFLRSRHGAAMLRSIGLDALVAADEAEYVRLAIELGRDAGLRGLRGAEVVAAMREGVPFLDSRQFGRVITEAYFTIGGWGFRD